MGLTPGRSSSPLGGSSSPLGGSCQNPENWVKTGWVAWWAFNAARRFLGKNIEIHGNQQEKEEILYIQSWKNTIHQTRVKHARAAPLT